MFFCAQDIGVDETYNAKESVKLASSIPPEVHSEHGRVHVDFAQTKT